MAETTKHIFYIKKHTDNYTSGKYGICLLAHSAADRLKPFAPSTASAACIHCDLPTTSKRVINRNGLSWLKNNVGDTAQLMCTHAYKYKTSRPAAGLPGVLMQNRTQDTVLTISVQSLPIFSANQTGT